MMLHHEVIQAVGLGFFGTLAWITFSVNAAVFYGRRAWKKFRSAKSSG